MNGVWYTTSHGVRINHRIRILDQVQYLGYADMARLQEEMSEDGFGERFALLYDASKATTASLLLQINGVIS